MVKGRCFVAYVLYVLKFLIFLISFDVAAEESLHIGGASDSTVIAKVILSLVAVLFLIAALAWLAKKLGYSGVGSVQRNMKVLDSIALGTREKAVLIDVAGKKILLGLAPGNVSSLHVFSEDECTAIQENINKKAPYDQKESKDDAPLTRQFSTALNQILNQGKPGA